jgi:pyridoxine 5'-phosphate synthase PdxJ
MNIYKAKRACIWNKKYWAEGEETSPIPELPNHHFKLSKGKEEIKEEKQYLSEITNSHENSAFTGVGICSGDDLTFKSLNQLVSLAKEKGVYKTTLRTKNQLIETIKEVH